MSSIDVRTDLADVEYDVRTEKGLSKDRCLYEFFLDFLHVKKKNIETQFACHGLIDRLCY